MLIQKENKIKWRFSDFKIYPKIHRNLTLTQSVSLTAMYIYLLELYSHLLSLVFKNKTKMHFDIKIIFPYVFFESFSWFVVFLFLYFGQKTIENQLTRIFSLFPFTSWMCFKIKKISTEFNEMQNFLIIITYNILWVQVWHLDLKG